MNVSTILIRILPNDKKLSHLLLWKFWNIVTICHPDAIIELFCNETQAYELVQKANHTHGLLVWQVN